MRIERMIGVKPPHVNQRLTDRQIQILSQFKRFDYLTVKHVQAMFHLGKSNTYRVLRQLRPYLNEFRDGLEKVYYLNKKGQELMDCKKDRKRLTTARHYIMRNDLYLFLGQPEGWENEVRLKYEYKLKQRTKAGYAFKPQKIVVVADAYYITDNDTYHIIEIDHLQKMNQNRVKIDKYRRLIEKGVFKAPPEFIWVTTTAYRQQALQELCDGLQTNIYLGSDLT